MLNSVAAGSTQKFVERVVCANQQYTTDKADVGLDQSHFHLAVSVTRWLSHFAGHTIGEGAFSY